MAILNTLLKELKLLKNLKTNKFFLPYGIGFYGIVQKPTAFFSIIILAAS